MRPLQPTTLVDTILHYVDEVLTVPTESEYEKGFDDACKDIRGLVLAWAKNVGQETNDKTS